MKTIETIKKELSTDIIALYAQFKSLVCVKHISMECVIPQRSI